MSAEIIVFPTRLAPVNPTRPTPKFDEVPAQLRLLADAIDDSRIGGWIGGRNAREVRFLRCATAAMRDIFDQRLRK